MIPFTNTMALQPGDKIHCEGCSYMNTIPSFGFTVQAGERMTPVEIDFGCVECGAYLGTFIIPAGIYAHVLEG